MNLNAQDKEIVANLLMSRGEFWTKFFDNHRDIDKECGYTATEQLTKEDYRLMYDREAIATRVVEIMPEESWKTTPSVYEDEDTEQKTDFEEAWDNLNRSLRGENSWYQDEEGGGVWEYLCRIDKLSGIGHYGVLLLGIDDGKELDQPVDNVVNYKRMDSDNRDMLDAPRVGGATATRKLLYIRPFDESLVQINKYETDKNNPRYGQPIEYLITFNDPRQQQGGIGAPSGSAPVHWSRVIHVADNLGSSEIFGVPRMRPVWNRLTDLRKLYGGSAEMYWRGAFPGLSIETHPQLGGDVELDLQGIRQEMGNYMQGLQRYLTLMGMSAKSLAPQVVDCTPQVDTAIESICILLGIPKRVFTGSERGELASSQDSKTWNDRLRKRQTGYITPRIIVPFVDRLILMGVLPTPTGYSVVWPELEQLSPVEQSQVAVARTDAMTKYVAGSVEVLMTPIDFLTRVVGFTDEEAEAITDSATEAMEEQQQEFEEQGLDQNGRPIETGEENNVQQTGGSVQRPNGGRGESAEGNTTGTR